MLNHYKEKFVVIVVHLKLILPIIIIKNVLLLMDIVQVICTQYNNIMKLEMNVKIIQHTIYTQRMEQMKQLVNVLNHINMLYKIHLMDQKNVQNHVQIHKIINYLIIIVYHSNVSVIVLDNMDLIKMDIVKMNVLNNMLDLHLVMYVIVNVIIILILMLNIVLLVIIVLLQDMTLFMIIMEDINVLSNVNNIHM